MEIVSKVLIEALDSSYISITILMCIILSFLHFANIVLGSIIGAKESKFDIKKFFFGVLKAICILFIIVGVCYILNVFTLTINLINGLNINTEIVTTLELIGILVTNGIDIAKEVLDKIKTFRDLKYTSYEDVLISDTNISEPVDFVG